MLKEFSKKNMKKFVKNWRKFEEFLKKRKNFNVLKKIGGNFKENLNKFWWILEEYLKRFLGKLENILENVWEYEKIWQKIEENLTNFWKNLTRNWRNFERFLKKKFNKFWRKF